MTVTVKNNGTNTVNFTAPSGEVVACAPGQELAICGKEYHAGSGFVKDMAKFGFVFKFDDGKSAPIKGAK